MAFSTTSFFAGVGAMLAAVTLGFTGGALVTGSPSVERNRLERIAIAQAPVGESATDKPKNLPASASAKALPPPDRVIAITPATASQPITESIPAVKRETAISHQEREPEETDARDTPRATENTQKSRRSEVREYRHLRAERRAEMRRERRRREIDFAANAVRQAQRDGRLQEVSQQDDGPRFGFFGND